METFVYQCPICGFKYFIPSYWMSYSAEPTASFPHMEMNGDKPCENETLNFVEEN